MESHDVELGRHLLARTRQDRRGFRLKRFGYSALILLVLVLALWSQFPGMWTWRNEGILGDFPVHETVKKQKNTKAKVWQGNIRKGKQVPKSAVEE